MIYASASRAKESGERSMSRGILIGLKYKEALIIKHLLRDKVDRDADEQILYDRITKVIEDFRTANSIQPKGMKQDGNAND